MNHTATLSNSKVSVLIADADLMSADLLAAELARGRQEISVVGVSNDSVQAIRELEKYQPNIALINTHLQNGKMTGYRVLQSLPAACPKTVAIMMIPVSDRELVIDAFRGGARGIVCRVNALKLLSNAFEQCIADKSGPTTRICYTSLTSSHGSNLCESSSPVAACVFLLRAKRKSCTYWRTA
jgi:DNA-binding NarL/FixJ family response regulator